MQMRIRKGQWRLTDQSFQRCNIKIFSADCGEYTVDRLEFQHVNLTICIVTALL